MKFPGHFFVFDVESIGLHGEGWAVGIVILNQKGETVHEACWWCDPDIASGTHENHDWVDEHCPRPDKKFKLPDLKSVRNLFWETWLHWKNGYGAELFADCQWPVEARFLASCVDDDVDSREWDGPYPFHDIASILWSFGVDPLECKSRHADELPEHHPLHDARQSARLLFEAIGGRGDSPPKFEVYTRPECPFNYCDGPNGEPCRTLGHCHHHH